MTDTSRNDISYDHPTGWPGIDDGVRAPYQGEVQLSFEEVAHGVRHQLFKETK